MGGTGQEAGGKKGKKAQSAKTNRGKKQRDKREQQQQTHNKKEAKEKEGEEEEGIGGYTPDTSLVRGVGALNDWFEPMAVKQFMCNEGIIADCRVHECLHYAALLQLHISAAFSLSVC